MRLVPGATREYDNTGSYTSLVATGDEDLDGSSNLDEWLDGTDPLDPLSFGAAGFAGTLIRFL